jgi:DNA-binding NarL/FixJ family response regulator
MKDEGRLGDGAIRVLVADSTRIHTQLLADALKRDHSLQVIAAASGSRTLISLTSQHNVDVVVISSSLDDEPGRGFEVLRELRAANSDIRAIILLDSSKREAILEAFRAGARGIFSRNESVETLCKCVRTVYEGQVWASSGQMGFAIEALAAAPTVRAIDSKGSALLSKRELEVVHCLAQGLTNREIAERLGLSQHTIKNYLFRIFDKLGVSSRIELLFLTLSQASTPAVQNRKNGSPADPGVTDCQQAAKEGLLTAPITLAEMYARGEGSPTDLISAYMWYLIANEQLLLERKELTKRMTMEELLEAERRAAEWLSQSRKAPPPSIQDHPDFRPSRLPKASSA